MKETKLLGKLLPSHPDILPVLEEIREKYQIPPIKIAPAEYGRGYF